MRLPSTFPDGPFGLGLFLLRVPTGIVGAAIGITSLNIGGSATVPRIAGMLAGVGGAALIAGAGTPVAGSLVAAIAAAMAISWLPLPPIDVLNDSLSIGFVAVVATAVVLLGPGAYSIDALLFGRREIVIPSRE